MTVWRSVCFMGALISVECGAVMLLAEALRRRDAMTLDQNRQCATLDATQRGLESPASR